MPLSKKPKKRETRALNPGINIKISPMSKRSQVAVFVIVAILIVIAGILVYLFYPQITSFLNPQEENPQLFIKNCIEDEIKNNVELVSSQGGSISPEHYMLYSNDKIEYLCYTEEYYATCVVQQPLLKEHIESEIARGINSKSEECFSSLRESYEKQGYGVNLGPKNISVELLPKRIVTTFDRTLTLTKDGSDRYDSFVVVLNNNLYELVSIADSIIGWETRYGDAETTIYMNYYHDLKVEKKKQSDGTTIYILTDRNNEDNNFQFASRSVAWPPGYGG